MCQHCFEWHNRALDLLANGVLPPGCQLCETPLAVLTERALGPATKLYVVPIDGIYAVACATCMGGYTHKRADLYRHTAYGQELKLC